MSLGVFHPTAREEMRNGAAVLLVGCERYVMLDDMAAVFGVTEEWITRHLAGLQASRQPPEAREDVTNV